MSSRVGESMLSTHLAWYAPQFSALRVHGVDAWNWLNGLVTCDVLAARKAQAVRGALLTKQGKIQAEFYVLEQDGAVVLAVAGGDAEVLASTLDGYLVMEDAEVQVAHLDFCWLFGERASDVARDLGMVGGALNAFRAPGYLGVSKPEHIERLRNDPVWTQWSEGQFEAFRIESGVAKWGVDFDQDDNLHAAGLERRLVDWSKGCYLGQEVVCMQEMRGKVRKSIVGLAVSGEAQALTPGELVNEAGESVGRITSASGDFGMGQVRSPENMQGTRLYLRGSGDPAKKDDHPTKIAVSVR